MKIAYSKKFLKDLSKIPIRDRKKIEVFVFNELPDYKHIYESGMIEKLKGYNEFYRTRFGNYRVGIYFKNDELILLRVLHRKEIYKVFP